MNLKTQKSLNPKLGNPKETPEKPTEASTSGPRGGSSIQKLPPPICLGADLRQGGIRGFEGFRGFRASLGL